MILVELGPDDFDRHGFALIGRVVNAIAKVIQSDSGLNPYQAEREAWPYIHTGVVRGALHPIDPGTKHLLSIENYGIGTVSFDELVAWGPHTKRFDFRKATSIAIDVQTFTTEEKTDATHRQAEYDEAGLNGEAIDWRYWVHQMPTLSAAQAACLMSALEPDKFANLNERPGSNDPAENIEKARKIQRLAETRGRMSAPPSEWVTWAKSLNISVHTGFLLAVWEMPEAPCAVPTLPTTVPINCPVVTPELATGGTVDVSDASEVEVPASEPLPAIADTVSQSAPALKAGTEPAPVMSAPASEPVLTGTVTYTTKESRRNILKPVIELAQSKCRDQLDTAAVWAQLQVLAHEESAPLLAVTGRKIKYMDGDKTCYLSRDALNKRLHPEKRGSPAKRR